MKRSILITGGAGFIGSHVVRLFVRQYPECNIINLDKLTYAGNLQNLRDIESLANYAFIKGDICDRELVEHIFHDFDISGVIHLAAESHVDRSIEDPFAFARTNILGTLTLLEAARKAWSEDSEGRLFYHISTDEVYGSLGPSDAAFTEQTRYAPHSPYSASKASSDHFVRAYHDTYGMPTVISNCSNNYGPYQFPEKLIPLIINNIKAERPLPVYGNGENVRDWLYVEDHARAIELIYRTGHLGETYNIGGGNEWHNIDIVEHIIRIADRMLGRPAGSSRKLITFVPDRAGHDLRYAIDHSKIERELGWKPQVSFEEGIEKTVAWYLANKEWLEDVTSGAYQDYYARRYGKYQKQ